MKQTNNAIKFLMAQYRAIFKNANLKMFLAAATAAAAMAAGSANAATTGWADLGANETIAAGETKAWDTTAASANGFNLKVEGALKLGGGNAKAEFTVAGGKEATVTLDGANASLIIGTDTQAASMQVTTFNANQGNVVVGSGAGAASSLEATTINVGSETNQDGKAEIVLGKSGALGGAQSNIKVYAGGTISLATDSDKANIAGKSLTLKGGAVNLENKDFTISSETINLQSGKLSNGTGTLTLDKVTTLSIAADTLVNAGTIDLGKLSENRSVSLTVDSSIFNEQLFKAADQKVAIAGTQGKDSTLDITVTGEEADLVGSGLFDAASGKIDATKGLVAGADTAKITVNLSGTSAKLAADTFDNDTAKFAATNLEFGTLTVGKGTADFTVKAGNLKIANGLTVSGSKGLVIEKGDLTLNGTGVGEAAGVVDASKLTLGESGKTSASLNVTGGDWKVGSLELQSGTITLAGGSKLILNKDASLSLADPTKGTLAANNATLDASAAGVINLGGESVIKLSNGGRVIFDAEDVYKVDTAAGTVTAANGDGSTGSKFTANAVSGDGNSFLQINVSGDAVTAEFAGKVKEAVAKTGFEGFIDFGDKIQAYDKPSVEYDKMTGGVNGMYANTQVQMGTDNNISQSVSAGNLKLSGTGTSAELSDKKTLVLTNANTELGNGMFVQDADGKVAGVKLGGADAALTLNGNGKVGSITAAADKNGTVTIGGSVNGNGTVTVEGSIGATGAAVKNLTVNQGSTLVVVGSENAKDVFTETLTLNKGSALNAVGQTVTVGGTTDTTINGNLSAKTLTFGEAGANATIANDAIVDVDELTLATSATGKIAVGTAGDTGTSGTLEVGKLTLNGGTLEVDPAIGQKAAVAAVAGLSKVENGVQVLDGNIVVGMNSVVGVGYDTRAEIESMLETLGYMDPATHGFMPNPADPDAPVTRAAPAVAENTLKAAFVVDTPIKIDNGKGITVDTSAAPTVTPDKVTLGADSSLIITDGAYQVVNGKKQGTAITFGKTGDSGEVSADASSKIILAGAFDGADSGINIFGNAKNVPTTLKVQSANGVLVGTLSATGAIASLDVNKDALKGMFSSVSTPVADLLKARIDGKDPRFDKTQLGATWLLDVAMDAVDTSGVKADAAAHAATYAGAQVAAVASVGTMAEAVGGRVGSIGVEAAAISATGSQATGGVWVSPMYKSVDADGFNAEGASYGADVDLAGVAFGADTVNGNSRFGMVFNIGSGESEGKGNGSGLKDDFDYYGIGIYSATMAGNFAVVGDASINVISHDVEGLGLKGSAETTALTAGLTGLYTMSSPMVDVTPHLGARFIRLDTDSYDLKSDKGILATTDFEVQNVFSVPLGVTLSKAFQMGGWSLAPSADLSITFNTGDTDAKSTTQFTGAYGIDLTSEVLDEVTYGVAVGLGAQYGAFGTQIGINYTGSENTDALGVNAQARYMF